MAPANTVFKHAHVDKYVHPRAHVHANHHDKDININAKDRKHLIADLKAIDALDREALQYLDTSCGSVKALDSKKTKHSARRVARHLKIRNNNN